MNDIDIINKSKQLKRKQKRFFTNDELNYILNRFKDRNDFTENLYRIEHNIENIEKCPYCNNLLKFTGHGYSKTCSLKCSNLYKSEQYKNLSEEEKQKQIQKRIYAFKNKSEEEKQQIINKRKKTTFERHGYITPFELDEIKNKIKQIMKERYGVENSFQNKEIYQKCCQTKLEKYGDLNNSKKRLKTCNEKYGGNAPICNLEIKEKIKNTCKEKYNCDNIMQTSLFKEKSKQTMNERYGVDYAAQNPEIYNKVKQTCKEKYGVEYGWNTEKQKQTMNERYGVDYAAQNPEIYNKVKQTCKEKYGGGSGFCSEKTKQTMNERYGVDYAAQNPEILNKTYITKRKNGTFTTSKFEEYVNNKLLEIFNKNDIIRQYHDKRYPFNCDFYIKSIDTFIEIQGSQFHHYHPFNPNNINDINELNKLLEKANNNQYTSIINTWTKYDVKKREIAKQNKLNYFEFFTILEFENWLNNYESK